ncbi:MAG: hypothetical protein QXG55_01765 [Thermoplasmata archaeon]
MKFVYKERGVASVIGTLFALLLGVTILSAFMTQYVPVYMKTNEYERDNTVLSQISQMKTIIDLYVATGQVNFSFTAPITLGASGIPVFAPSSPSTLMINTSGLPIFSLNFTSGNQNMYFNSSGYFYVKTINSYYPQEKIIFINGAIVRENINQNSSAIFVGPSFSISHQGNQVILNFYLYTIIGPYYSYTGIDTQNLQFNVLSITKNTFNTNVAYLKINSYYSSILLSWYQNKSSIYGYSNSSINGNNILFEKINMVNIVQAYIFVQDTSQMT